jgi:hypothetical protein
MRRALVALLGLVIVPLAWSAEPTAPVWTTDLTKMTPPNTPAGGQLLGGEFKVESAKYDSFVSVLELRQGKDFFPEASVKIFLFLKQGESPEGKTFEVAAEKFPKQGTPHVHIGRIPPGEKLPKGTSFVGDYAMKLEFGKAQDGKVPARIYICMPDEKKSVVAGTFMVDLPKQ